MPIHDWTRLEPGDFHHFHQRWISALTDSLNGGLLAARVHGDGRAGHRPPDPGCRHAARPPAEGRPGRDRRRHGPADRPGDRQIREDQLREAGRPGRHPPRPGSSRRDHRDPVTGEQGQSQRDPIVRREGGRHPEPGGEPARRGPFPADAPRPAGDSQGDLGRVRGRALRGPAGQAADRRLVHRRRPARRPMWNRSGSATRSRLCRSSSRRRDTSRLRWRRPTSRPGRCSRPCSRSSSTRRLAENRGRRWAERHWARRTDADRPVGGFAKKVGIASWPRRTFW